MELQFEERHKYRLGKPVHSTPNSKLYKAMDLDYGRDVAIKEIIIEGKNEKEKSFNYSRAFQEVKTMIQISFLTSKIPNIYATYYDKKNSKLYIVMQWINGKTLADKMKGRLLETNFLNNMQELCEILDVMDKRNFQHKDIKPENIMFNENNELYLIDFNLSVSNPNMIDGTMFYKAPEMDLGSQTVSRKKADMFSIGVMMYYYFTKKLPSPGIDYMVYDSSSHRWDYFTEPKDINPEIHLKINDLIVKLMAYEENDRFRDYRELNRAIEKVKRIIRNGKRKKQ